MAVHIALILVNARTSFSTRSVGSGHGVHITLILVKQTLFHGVYDATKLDTINNAAAFARVFHIALILLKILFHGILLTVPRTGYTQQQFRRSQQTNHPFNQYTRRGNQTPRAGKTSLLSTTRNQNPTTEFDITFHLPDPKSSLYISRNTQYLRN